MANQIELQDNAAYHKTKPKGKKAPQYPDYEEIIIGGGGTKAKSEEKEPFYDEVMGANSAAKAGRVEESEHQYEEPQ
jgi:hypothetical protein